MNCPNCGNQVQEGMNHCPYCGTSLNNNNTTINNIQNVYVGASPTRPNIKKRDIIVSVILSIITCGIYSLYWYVVLTDETNILVDEKDKTASGGLALIFGILSCGIYYIYWSYKIGKKLCEAGKKYGIVISDNSILFLILSLFGLTWVNFIITQSELNKLANQ